jgi:hypothetical protein
MPKGHTPLSSGFKNAPPDLKYLIKLIFNKFNMRKKIRRIKIY